MTNQSYGTNRSDLIPPHGGYRSLRSWQAATLVYDLTVEFCRTYKSDLPDGKAGLSYLTYQSYLAEPEAAANALICLIHQANFLLDQQLRALEKDFLEKGGFTEKLYKFRKEHRGY